MFTIMATARGPSIVEHGIISIGFASVNKDDHNNVTVCARINMKPFAAQLDNKKQDHALTDGAVDPLEAMKMVHDFLETQKGAHCVVLGDVTGINYYLSMAERPGLFERPFSTIHCETADKQYWTTQGLIPDIRCKEYLLTK